MADAMAEEAPLTIGPPVRERVRWSDIDAMGIVYYGRYLRFMEAAEAELFRTLGFSYANLSDVHGVWMARVRLEVQYRAPAQLDDDVVCRAAIRTLGGSSLTLDFPIDRADGVRLADGVLVVAALDRTTLRPARLPGALAAAIRAAAPAYDSSVAKIP
jgi:YbgC/YbaW family acyl-CoA thioester hydrolase